MGVSGALQLLEKEEKEAVTLQRRCFYSIVISNPRGRGSGGDARLWQLTAVPGDLLWGGAPLPAQKNQKAKISLGSILNCQIARLLYYKSLWDQCWSWQKVQLEHNWEAELLYCQAKNEVGARGLLGALLGAAVLSGCPATTWASLDQPKYDNT